MTLPPITFRQSPFQNARSTYALRGIVSHRIVGTLLSARAAFGVAPGTPRNASTHFGIGYDGGRLVIDQFVRLDRMAWGNGDVRDPTWSRIIAGVNPNLYTVSIEHEDGGSAGRGIVKEPIWQASMELQALLISGNAAAIRAAGIQGATDAMVAQLAAIPKDASGFIDHHQISGPNKPYCFRRWLDDPGFVYGSPSRRDRLLAVVKGGSSDVPIFLRPVFQKWTTGAGDFQAASTTAAPGGQSWTGGPGLGAKKAFPGPEVVQSIAETDDGLWRLLLLGVPPAAELRWMHRYNLRPIDGTRIPASGFGLVFGAGLTEEQAEAREKAAAIDVKAAAATAAAKYGG